MHFILVSMYLEAAPEQDLHKPCCGDRAESALVPVCQQLNPVACTHLTATKQTEEKHSRGCRYQNWLLGRSDIWAGI